MAVAAQGASQMHENVPDVAAVSPLARPIPIFVAPHYIQELAKAREAVSHRKLLFPKLASQYHPPPYHALNMIKTVFYMLGYTAAELGNPEAADPERFSWAHARRHFTAGFVQELLTLDPSEEDDHDGLLVPQPADPNAPRLIGDDALPLYMRALTMKRVVENLLESEVMEQGPAFKAMLKWIRVAADIRATAVEQRDRTRILRAAGL